MRRISEKRQKRSCAVQINVGSCRRIFIAFDPADERPQTTLAKAIQSQFAPTLRRDGFSGTGQRYWRVISGQCQLIEVQGSRYGGKFAVNMGIQPLSVPLRSGEPPNPRRIREMSCMSRRRLSAQRSDQWWDYQPNQESMEAAACAVCVVYEQVGRGQLGCRATIKMRAALPRLNYS
jgi:hypothetical protein